MNRPDLDSNFVSDYSWLQDFLDAHSIPTDPCNSQPSMAGYSAQTLDSFYYGYLNQEVINQDTPSSPRSLNDFSISHLPSTENKLLLPELSPEELEEILSSDFASEPVDDNFAFTDSTFTNSQKSAQKLPPENSLVSFSQPSSRPVAIVGPLNKDTQEQVTTETIQFKAPESSGSGETLAPTLALAQEQSEKGNASKRAWIQSEKAKAYKRAWAQSEKGKATRKAYRESEKGRASRKAYRESEKGKAYEQSEKRKASRKAYRESEKGKAYEQSEKRKAYQKAYQQSEKGKASRKASRKAYAQSERGKANRKTYEQSEKRKASMKAYKKAYNKAYKEVFKNTGDQEQARIAGKQAAALIRKSNKSKLNQPEFKSKMPNRV